MQGASGIDTIDSAPMGMAVARQLGNSLCSLAHSFLVSKYSILTNAWSCDDSSRSHALPSCSGHQQWMLSQWMLAAAAAGNDVHCCISTMCDTCKPVVHHLHRPQPSSWAHCQPHCSMPRQYAFYVSL